MQTIGMIFDNLAEIVEAAILVYFFHKMFEFKEEVSGRTCKMVTLFLTLYAMARLCIEFELNDLIFTVLWLSVLLLYSNRYLKSTKMQHLLWSMYTLLLIPLVNLVLLLLACVATKTSTETFISIDNPNWWMIVILSRCFYYGILRLTLYFNKERKVKLSRKYVITMVILFGYSIVIEAILLAGFQFDNGESYKLGFLCIALGVVLVDTYLFVMIFKISEKSQQEERLRLLQVQNELQERRILEAETETRRIRQIRHDYKSLISNINVMLEKKEYEKIQEYLEEITGYYLKSIPEYICTKNSLLDAAINTKFAYCNENGIETSCKIVGDCNGIDDFQLAVIALNLMDNAIEASEKEIEKEIDLQMKQDDEYIHLIVRNRIRNSVLEKNPELKSSKEEKGHGLGLEHVKNILEENKGLWEVYEEKGWFCVHVMFLKTTKRL